MRFHFWNTFLLCLLINIIEISSKSNAGPKFLGKYAIPNKKTNSPINVDTSKVIGGKYGPFELRGIKSEKLKLYNSGYTAETDEILRSESYLTGGVLGEVKYEFYKIRFFWTDDLNGTAAGSIDGKGNFLQAVVYFFKRNYKTFYNAMNYRDGLAVLIFPIIICPTDSSTFPPFGAGLKKILEAGSVTITTLGDAISWYDPFPNMKYVPLTYYVYPGAYHEEETGNKYFCEIDIALDIKGACLSKEQFDSTFGSMKDLSGNPLTYTQKNKPLKGRPIVSGKGLIREISP